MEDLSQEPLGSLRQPMELYTVFTAVHCANLSVEIVVTIRVAELAEVPFHKNIEKNKPAKPKVGIENLIKKIL